MTWVYVVQADNGPLKIGFTADVKTRVRAFQANSPNVISVVAVVRGGSWLEAKMKRRWRKHQMWGEWFRPASEVMVDVALLKEKGGRALLSGAELLFDGDAPLHRIGSFYGFGSDQVREWLHNGIPEQAEETITRICPPIQACTLWPHNACQLSPHHPANALTADVSEGPVSKIDRLRPGRRKLRQEAA